MSDLITAGDFTGLAKDYSLSRPDYCPLVLKGLIGLLDVPLSEVDFVDVGAGTGIWTRMVYLAGVKSATAIEPNSDMLANGISDSRLTKINWKKGYAENTGLPSNYSNWLTMASSFHWTDFDSATKEFYRILKPNGRFSALWNPRLVEVNPILSEIESYLHQLGPSIKRVSSGRSGITDTLTERLSESQYFEDVVYLEGRHVIEMSPERYLGAWRSVNDLRVQLGAENFKVFLSFVESRISNMSFVKATYLTRAWSARRKD